MAHACAPSRGEMGAETILSMKLTGQLALASSRPSTDSAQTTCRRKLKLLVFLWPLTCTHSHGPIQYMCMHTHKNTHTLAHVHLCPFCPSGRLVLVTVLYCNTVTLQRIPKVGRRMKAFSLSFPTLKYWPEVLSIAWCMLDLHYSKSHLICNQNCYCWLNESFRADSVIQCLPNIHKALSSIHSTT